MPRPGPRPYECVRRTWHSDRHHPIRGSLIQEIFRIANEVHTTATKNNKEWQEKLPIVVLKAEEIMYSRANSEAEYMDLSTLRNRTNDAINTIIRLDESTETGEFLQPCVEAALLLGCTPRRSSRSHQNNPPTCYLGPKNPNPCTLFAGGLLETGKSIPSTSWCFASPSSDLARTAIGNSGLDCSKSQSIVFQTSLSQNRDADSTQFGCINDYAPGVHQQQVFSLCGQTKELENTSTIRMKTDVSAPTETLGAGGASSFSLITSSRFGRDDGAMSSREVECDLSLRLGSLTSTSEVIDEERRSKNGVGDAKNWVWDYLNTRSSKWNEQTNPEITSKKRKTSMFQSFDDPSTCWQLKVPCYQSPFGAQTRDESVGP